MRSDRHGTASTNARARFPGPAAQAVLETHSLRAAYEDVPAMRGVSSALAREEIVGFPGTNGGGKATTLMVTESVLLWLSATVFWKGKPSKASFQKPEPAGIAFDSGVSSVISGSSAQTT
jgi:ABC-type branched-subunit amino acid transport system ATPase component